MRIGAAALAALAAASGATARALEPGDDAEIVVTARKIEENLQDAPLAITAIGAEALDQSGATDVTAVTGLAPNVQFESGSSFSGSSGTPTLFVRGIGQADFVITSDPAVGVYVDGVYVARTLGSLVDLIDVERIEVLRGPQGTLFGRNTLGGAVSLVSKSPGEAFSAGVRQRVGTFGLTESRVFVDAPLGEELGVRVSGLFRRQDGYVDAVNYPDFAIGGEKVAGGRIQTRWRPTERLTIDVSGDYTRDRSSPAPFYAIASIPDIPLAGTAPTFVNAFNRALSGDPSCVTPEGQRDNAACYGAASVVTGPFETNSVWFDTAGRQIRPRQQLDSFGVHGVVEWETDAVTLKSISAWRGFEASFNNDADFCRFIVFQNLNTDYYQRQFSQELQAVGALFEDRLEWVAGLFYFAEDGVEQLDVLTSVAIANRFPTAPVFLIDDRRIDNTSYAAYGQATLNLLSDRLHLTGGLRYTQSNKRYSQKAVNNPAVNAGVRLFGDLEVERVNPLVTVAIDATEDVLLYATYSSGFRDGGFPSRVVGTPEFIPSFRPEEVRSWEAGLKSELFDQRLRLNLAGFTTRYEDIQVPAVRSDLPPQQQALSVANLASASIRGVELEAALRITRALRLDASVGWLDDDIKSVVGGQLISGAYTITADNELPYTPDWTANLRATWDQPLPNGAALEVTSGWTFISSQFFGVENRPEQFQQGKSRLDAQARYVAPSGRWELGVGGENLTDEVYSTTAILATGAFARNVARPRQLYGFAAYRWGN